MHLSATLFLTDILPEKRRLFNKIVKNKILSKALTHNETLARLREAGIDGIELLLPSFAKQVNDEDFKVVKGIVEGNQLKVLSLHESLRYLSKTNISEIERLFRIADFLDAKVVVLHINLVGNRIFDKKFVQKIHELQDHYGITVGFENREKMAGPFRAKHTWQGGTFASLLQENNLSITLDTTHLAQSGGDIVSSFKEHTDKIVNIHISDYREHPLNSTLRPFRYKHLPLGKGELPLVAFLEALRDANYKGLVTVEIHTDLQGICESAKMINQIVNKSS